METDVAKGYVGWLEQSLMFQCRPILGLENNVVIVWLDWQYSYDLTLMLLNCLYDIAFDCTDSWYREIIIKWDSTHTAHCFKGQFYPVHLA